MIWQRRMSFVEKEQLKWLLEGSALVCLIGYLFYKSLIGIGILSPSIYYYFQRKKRKKAEQKKDALTVEFKDALISISAALQAGVSMENAVGSAAKDMAVLYGTNSHIVQELHLIEKQLNMSYSIEQSFWDFAKRSGIEDIRHFAEVLSIGKRTGGNLLQMIRTTSKMMTEKIEVQREIKTLIAAKQLEVNIMNLIPIFIILYLWFCSPGFLDVLYHTSGGILMMTLILCFYGSAFLCAEKIVQIPI